MRSRLCGPCDWNSRAPGNNDDGIITQSAEAPGDLIRDLYNLAEAPKNWRDFLARLCDLLDADRAAIVRHGPGQSNEILSLYDRRASRAHDDASSRQPAAANDLTCITRLLPVAIEKLAEDGDAVLSLSVGQADLQSEPLEIRTLLIGRTGLRGDAIIHVALGRVSRTPFNPSDEALLRSTLSHLEQSAQLGDLLKRLRADAEASSAMLDAVPIGIAILDDKGRSLTVNHQARRLIGADGGMLRQIAALASKLDDCSPEPSIFNLPHGTGRRPLAVIVWRLMVGLAEHPYHVAFLVDRDCKQSEDIAPKALEGLYGLTSAEARVAALLARNNSVAEMAGTLGTTLHTIRTHLRHIFEKTRTQRQIDLVHLLLRLVIALRPLPDRTRRG